MKKGGKEEERAMGEEINLLTLFTLLTHTHTDRSCASNEAEHAYTPHKSAKHSANISSPFAMSLSA